jgi:hypothetical protein
MVQSYEYPRNEAANILATLHTQPLFASESLENQQVSMCGQAGDPAVTVCNETAERVIPKSAGVAYNR